MSCSTAARTMSVRARLRQGSRPPHETAVTVADGQPADAPYRSADLAGAELSLLRQSRCTALRRKTVTARKRRPKFDENTDDRRRLCATLIRAMVAHAANRANCRAGRQSLLPPRVFLRRIRNAISSFASGLYWEKDTKLLDAEQQSLRTYPAAIVTDGNLTACGPASGRFRPISHMALAFVTLRIAK